MTVRTHAEAKAQARALRQALAATGTEISHSEALERVARQNGARDWNTLSAKLAQQDPEPAPLRLGDSVSGRYLGQPFTGRIAALTRRGSYTRLLLRLDAPVDTVRFTSFTNLRRQIRAVIGPDGRSSEKTSDGTPHLVIDLGKTSGR